ncbi:hypothetical protein VII00023_20402 [Vibrio ichthyoenteri ATCC 700023]|uniref:Lysoplasmalogenase n=1 Tax=Vibrio ichthyoenteri ATCC 700023 TaxID=870968 RepID=F9RXL2_9VIBR|nr:lysoplasmalogenase [Vibrio ichthyoenteri]EGU47792.1 hypothetical protein VII00023_20402 [Vibrio ichthyoenteri ATCC 700023]
MWFAIVSLCLVHIYTISRGPRWLFYLSKPLPVVLLTFLVVTNPSDSQYYNQIIACGLILSVIGDVLLMSPRDRFRAGLWCFFAVQVCYGYAFSLIIPHYSGVILPIILSTIGLVVFLLLLPNMQSERWHVACYVSAILFMAWNAIEAWQSSPVHTAVLAGIGAIIFIMSDLVLAIDRFRASSDYSRHVVMFTYYTAQSLIALSAIWML